MAFLVSQVQLVCTMGAGVNSGMASLMSVAALIFFIRYWRVIPLISVVFSASRLKASVVGNSALAVEESTAILPWGSSSDMYFSEGIGMGVTT